jgi:hypothetical protein
VGVCGSKLRERELSEFEKKEFEARRKKIDEIITKDFQNLTDAYNRGDKKSFENLSNHIWIDRIKLYGDGRGVCPDKNCLNYIEMAKKIDSPFYKKLGQNIILKIAVNRLNEELLSEVLSSIPNKEIPKLTVNNEPLLTALARWYSEPIMKTVLDKVDVKYVFENDKKFKNHLTPYEASFRTIFDFDTKQEYFNKRKNEYLKEKDSNKMSYNFLINKNTYKDSY